MEEIMQSKEALFTPEAKLSFRIFSDLQLREVDVTLLHLISSSVLEGNLINVNFYNASFLSTKFVDVIFESCDLTCTDICSIWAKNCRFTDSDFTNATISDCTFIKCTFSNCSFGSVSLNNSHFVDCTFETLPIEDSTVTLNTFTRCSICNSSFTESFYYQIFEDCTFNNATIPVPLLGFNFGFSEEVFQQFAGNSCLSDIEKDLVEKGLFINAAILRVNQVKSYYDIALLACTKALSKMIERDILVKADEIQFIRKLTNYLYERNQIAPVSLIRIWQELYYISKSDIHNSAFQKALPHIHEYANMLYFNVQEFQERLQKSLIALPSKNPNQTVEIKIVYSTAPALKLLDCLEHIHVKCCNTEIRPQLLRTEVGSYIEYLEIAEAAIPYLQTLFSLLGVIVPFVIYHKQKKDHEKEKVEEAQKAAEAERVYEQERLKREATLANRQSGPSIILPQTTILVPETNILLANTARVISDYRFIENQSYYGYNAHNIKSITITTSHTSIR